MILIDTSALVGSLCGHRQSEDRLDEFMSAGERFLLSTITLYEWYRGPRSETELEWQELLFPSEKAVPFGYVESVLPRKSIEGSNRRATEKSTSPSPPSRSAMTSTSGR